MVSLQIRLPSSTRQDRKDSIWHVDSVEQVLQISPAVGACMAELILDGQSRTVDISPFNLKRYEEGNYFQGENAYESLWR